MAPVVHGLEKQYEGKIDFLRWEGDVVHGSGTIGARSGAFAVAAGFPSLRGEPPPTIVTSAARPSAAL